MCQAGCGKIINEYSGGRPKKYCGAECRRRAQLDQKREQFPETDGKCQNPECANSVTDWLGFGAPPRYCSLSCRNRANYLRQRARQQAKPRPKCRRCLCGVPDLDSLCPTCYIDTRDTLTLMEGAGI